MDIKIVNDTGEPVEQVVDEIKSPDGLSVPHTPELELKAMGDVLDLSEGDRHKYQDKLETLLEYAKMKSEDKSFEGLKWAIRNLGFKLNTPNIGEKMIDYMHRFAYLELESMKIDEEKKKYYDN